MGWVVNVTPRPPYPRERPGTHCTGGWVGPRAGLEGCGKSRPPPGFDPRTVHDVASRYTDWAIPAHTKYLLYAYFMERILISGSHFWRSHPGTPPDSMWLANVTSSLHTSNCHLRRPRTPHRTLPVWMPILISTLNPVASRTNLKS